MARKFVLLFLFCASFEGSAADSPLWVKEVTVLRTVALGADFSLYPECPKKFNTLLNQKEYVGDYEPNYPAEFKDKACFKTTMVPPLIKGAQIYVISNLPFIKGGGREVTVTLIDGHIEEIDFDFLNQYRDSFFQALVEKYGEPSKQSVTSYQNGFGQRFQGITARWFGLNATLFYDEYTSRKDWGSIVMYSKRFGAIMNARRDDSKNSIKGGL